MPERGELGYVYVLDDLTEIRRLEREVRMQDKLAAVGRLAAAIAHEIRNPLTSIAGSVSMLSGVPEMNEDHRRLLDIVTRESQRLNSIITDFLAYSRTKQYHFDRVDLIQSGRRHADADGSPHDGGENRNHDRAALRRAPGLGYRRRRQDSSRCSGICVRTRSAP